MISPPVVTTFGLPLDAVTREAMVARVDQVIADGSAVWLTFVNVAVLVQVMRDPQAGHTLQKADYRLCDGMGLLYASRWLGEPLPEMVSGPYLLFRLLERADAQGYSAYFLGGTPEVIEAAMTKVRHLYPRLRLAGYRDGFFTEDQQTEVVAEIRASRAQLLFVGMGFPRERLFLAEQRAALGVPVCMDVGGAFTVLAGIHQLAPLWVRRLGLEWVYRMLQEPQRLWRRYLVTNLVFGGWLLRALWKKALAGSRDKSARHARY